MYSASAPVLQQLRDQVRRMEHTAGRVDLDSHPATAGLPQLRSGGSYEISDAGLALALLAGPSAAGQWGAVVGFGDFSAEAAAGLGVDLTRTVLVPEPGDQWLEVTAALVDVLSVVLLRPVGRVPDAIAARLAARLRKRGAVLLVHAAPGSWPRCEARLSVDAPTWTGLGTGHGRLRSRRVTVRVHRGAAPPYPVQLQLPAEPGSASGPLVQQTQPIEQFEEISFDQIQAAG